MSKNPAKKTTSKLSSESKESFEIPSAKTGNGFVKNLVILIVSVVLTAFLIKENSGYNWVWNDLIHENLKFIRQNPALTTELKYQSKFGIDAAVLDYIKQKTPENAVILFPPGKVIMNDSGDYKFLKGVGGIKSRVWATYFLYPRKVVFEDERAKTNFIPTHVVTLYNWGYDQLNYKTEQNGGINILPINQ